MTSILRCQFGILRLEHGKHRKYLPFAFTEQGVAMLSSVLKSERAVMINVSIMRAFVKMRQLLNQESLSDRMSLLEKSTDKLFRVVFERLDAIEDAPASLPGDQRKIGFEQE